MNIEERQLTLFEKITVTIMIMLLQYDTASLFGDHWVLYIIYGVILNLAVWWFVGWYTYRYGRRYYLHLQKWKIKVGNFWLFKVGCRVVNNDDYIECCELIDKLCKDKKLNIEDKKVLYDNLCRMWTSAGMWVSSSMPHGIYQIPFFIQEKWKKAQAEDKLRQLKKDF